MAQVLHLKFTVLIGAEGSRAKCQRLPCRWRKAGENRCWTDSVQRPPFSITPI